MDVSTPNHTELNAGIMLAANSDGKSIGSGGNSNNTGNAGSYGNSSLIGIADMSRPPRAPIHGLTLDPFDVTIGSQASESSMTEAGAASDSEHGAKSAPKRSRASTYNAPSATYSSVSAGSVDSSQDTIPVAAPERSRMASRNGGSRNEGEDYSQGVEMSELGTYCSCPALCSYGTLSMVFGTFYCTQPTSDLTHRSCCTLVCLRVPPSPSLAQMMMELQDTTRISVWRAASKPGAGHVRNTSCF